MKHKYIGKTGLRVNPMCLGTITTEQLDPIFKAMDMTLSDDVLKACDKVF